MNAEQAPPQGAPVHMEALVVTPRATTTLPPGCDHRVDDPLVPSERPVECYPWGPLVPLLRARLEPMDVECADTGKRLVHDSDTRVADLFGVNADTVRRWRLRGVTERVADLIATRLGWRAGAIWPEYDDATAALTDYHCATPLERKRAQWRSRAVQRRAAQRSDQQERGNGRAS